MQGVALTPATSGGLDGPPLLLLGGGKWTNTNTNANTTVTDKRTHDDSVRPLLGNMSIDHHVLHPEHSYLPVNDEVLLDTSDTETV